ncbi:hypothetical protein G9464_10175 [Halostella sp. JP-L12]|uniref:hypothetical protein n=1 Tax=Halostella TaxID=1843185 RepID=UPI0013CEDB8B|nr:MULTISPECIES: hypothetical protein [Halostella]NHN47961.1 hypothetical protein [Halostella sp. JP-L12]
MYQRVAVIALVGVVLGSTVAALPASGATGQTAAQAEADGIAPDAAPPNETGGVDTYAVSQNGDCVEVAAFGDGDDSVGDFYQYGSHSGLYSSQGTNEYQRWDESQLFLYDGDDGGSVVFVHGEAGSERGGGQASVTMTGLPDGAEWVVEDDNYDTRNDNFTVEDGRAHADWFWEENRTDGGALRGLERGDYEAITIDAGFNEDAHHASLRASLTVDTWRLRGADGEDYVLDRSEPVTIRPGSCTGTSTQVATNGSDAYAATARNVGDNATFDTALTTENASGVAVDQLAVAPPANQSWFQIDLRATTDSPVAGDGPEEPLLFVEPTSPQFDESPDRVQYFVSLDDAELADRGIRSENVALFQYRDGEWHRVSHLTRRGSGDHVIRSTNATGMGPLAVAVLQPDVRTQELSLSSDTVEPGEEFEVRATLVNEGPANSTYETELRMFDETVDRASVVVPPNEPRTVTFTQSVESPGTYTVEVGDATTEIRVEGDGGGSGDGGVSAPGSVPLTVVLAGALVAALVVAGVGYRSR